MEEGVGGLCSRAQGHKGESVIVTKDRRNVGPHGDAVMKRK